MRHAISLLAAAATMLVAGSAVAQDQVPNYEKGPVWDIETLRTKDGHFDDYMKWVSTVWKAQEEALKASGDVVDYKVYVVVDPRNNEPDVMLATAYRSAAAMMDHSVADEFAFGQKLYGSVTKANQQTVERGALRTPMDEIVLREVRLK